VNLAKSLNLWEHIDPEILKLWPERPNPPEVEDYKGRELSSGIVSGTAESLATIGRMQTRGFSRTETLGESQGANRVVPTSIVELTAKSTAEYTYDWQTYLYRDKKFDKFETNLQSLKA